MKHVLRHCVICRRFSFRPYSYPKIPDFPPAHLNDQRRFVGVGIDYTDSLFCRNVFFNYCVHEDNFSKCCIVIYKRNRIRFSPRCIVINVYQ